MGRAGRLKKTSVCMNAQLHSYHGGIFEMNSSKFRKIECSLAAVAVALVTTAMPAAASAQEAEASASSINTIVVTARKREEDLLKTPLAITAIGSEDIAVRGITTIADVIENTPGINVTSANSGRNDRSFQQVSMRGFTPSTTTSQLTATFIDGVPVASATALNSVTDPARIEILKGPQNAYFGRNAFAGAFNIVTKDPGDTFGGSVSAEAGNRSSYDVQASVDGPIIEDVLGVAVSGHFFTKDGSYKNRYNPNQTLGDQETRTGTLALNFTPTSNLKIKAFGLYSEDHDGPSADGILSMFELRANNGSINIPYLSGNTAGTVILPSQANCMINGLATGLSATEPTVSRPYICGAIPAVSSFSPTTNTIEDPLLASILANGAYRVVSPGEGTQGYGLVREYYHLHLGIDYEIGDTGVTLSSLTGYNNEFYSQLDDLDNWDGSLLNGALASTGPAARQIWNFPFVVERVNKDFSQEFRASYDNRGPLQAMIGVSYLNTETKSDLLSVFSEEQSNFPRSSGTLSPPGKAETWGVFGSLSYDVTDAVNISLEGRYQIDEIFAIAGGRGLTILPNNANGLPAGTYAYDETFFSKKYKNFMPRAIVNFDVNPDMIVYASYAKAANVSIGSFNTGFLNGTPAEIAAAESIGLQVVLKPEKLDNFELGLKGSFLDGRLRVALAAFHAIWKDQYNARTTFIVDNSQTPPRTQIISGVANSGKTNITGLELDLWAEPVDGLTLTLSTAVNDSSIKSFADPSISKLTGLIDDEFRGNQLPLTSKYSANLGAMYTTEIPGWDDGSFFLRTDVSYKSKQFVDAGNLTWIKGRATVNMRAGIKRDGYSLEVFANNLLNDRNYTSVAQNNLLTPGFGLTGGTNSFGYIAPGLPELRTVGVKAGYQF